MITRALTVMLLLASMAAPVRCQAAKLDINHLYSLPWIIGTAPKGFQWSADSQRLAFLWNDEGTNFYDVWITDTRTRTPRHITRMPRLEAPSNPGTDIAKLQQAAKAEVESGVASVVWSPDQKQLLFVFQGQLYSVTPDSVTTGNVPKLVSSASNVSLVKPAPSGSNIAFLAGSELFVADATSGASHSTKLSNIEDFYWSHNGKKLAVVESDESRMPVRGIPDYLAEETTLRMVKRPFPGEPSELRRLGILSLSNNSAIQWADLGGDPMDLIFNVAWSPDDRTLLVDKSDLYIKDRRLLTIDPESGNNSLLLRERDPQNITEDWWADWAPDNSGVYFTSDRDNDYHVYFVSRKGGKPTAVTSGHFAVFSASINSPTNAIFFTSNEGHSEERHLYRVALQGGAPQRMTHGAGTHAAIVSPDGKWAADYFSSDLVPPDLYLQSLDKEDELTQITRSPRPEFKNYNWVPASYVTFPSTADGVMLHARLTLPANFDKAKRYPAILGSVYSNTVHNQWGGRVAHPTWGLDQYFAQEGYILLNVDIRGSSGHGKAFRQRLALDYGGIDVEDLYSGVKFLERQGYADMRRIGMWGSSYGGLLTTTSLFTKPGVYKAGVAGAPATSLFHALTGEMRTMMAPQDHRLEYTKASAYLKSGGMQDHLMIIHGMRDEIVLFKDSVTLEQRLITQGKDIQLVVLPDAPHSWDTGALAQTRYAYGQLIAFFKRYLGESNHDER